MKFVSNQNPQQVAQQQQSHFHASHQQHNQMGTMNGPSTFVNNVNHLSQNATNSFSSPMVAPPTATVESVSNETEAAPSSGALDAAAKSVIDPNKLLLSRNRLQDLVKEVDPSEVLDEDVEEVLLQVADDFIENIVTSGCMMAKHRKSSTLEAKDVQLHLQRNWNMWIPGFGGEEMRPYRRPPITDAHKQRMALIKKTLKKF